MSDSRKSPGAAAPGLAFDPLRVIGSGAEAMQPLVKSASQINLEIAGFATSRARAWMETSAALMRCRTPQDLLQTQMGFWRDAGQDWLATGRRIGEAWQSVLAAPGGPSRQGKAAERDVIDIRVDGEPVTPAPARNGHAARRPAERRAA